MQRLVDGGIVSPEAVEQMIAPQVLKMRDDALGVIEHYGRGIGIYEDQGSVRIGYTGHVSGFKDYVFWYPDARMVTAVLSNTEAAGEVVDQCVRDLITPLP